MKFTGNYNLKKPDYTDIADIPGDFNGNMDTIDTELKKNADDLAAHKEDVARFARISFVDRVIIQPNTETVLEFNSLVGGSKDIKLLSESNIGVLKTGLYAISFLFSTNPKADGNISVEIKKSTSESIIGCYSLLGETIPRPYPINTLTGMIFLNKDDVIKVHVRHNASVPIQIGGTNHDALVLFVKKVN